MGNGRGGRKKIKARGFECYSCYTEAFWLGFLFVCLLVSWFRGRGERLFSLTFLQWLCVRCMFQCICLQMYITIPYLWALSFYIFCMYVQRVWGLGMATPRARILHIHPGICLLCNRTHLPKRFSLRFFRFGQQLFAYIFLFFISFSQWEVIGLR